MVWIWFNSSRTEFCYQLTTTNLTNYESQIISILISNIIASTLSFKSHKLNKTIYPTIKYYIRHDNHIDIISYYIFKNLNSREKFDPGLGFEPRTTKSLAWRSEVQIPVQVRIFLLNLNCNFSWHKL